MSAAITRSEHNRSLIYNRLSEFTQAWGDATNAQRFMLAAANAINGDEKLQVCSDASKLSCLMQLCQWRLMLGKSLGHVFLVPFKNKATKQFECTILVGYKGYCALAYRSGLTSYIQAKVVYEKDKFDYVLGSDAKLSHVPSEEKDRGKRRGVWLMIEFKNGSKFIDFMTAEEMAPVKAFALGNKDGFSPWSGAFEDEMWCKSLIRRDAKRLALGETFEQAVSYESQIETMQAEQGDDPPLPYPRKAIMERSSVLENATGVIVEVKSERRHGKKGERDYNLYTVILDNGQSFATFNDEFAARAMGLKETAETCLIEYKMEEYGRKMLNVELLHEDTTL